ncbi:hypothetical protein [Bacteriovorax sp. Seq25_V]|uniref:hypothetical protein n=1 Tax=Bacteriovorax sp. Seq25_V TaxID=1201288 RepID=UPI000389DE42|nr:hypothetical protein [Bacteriovorax sp. Seq25_V]EQC46263.1 hypothetical protein M900_1622 [Bacteriovorax sp. Seq25_V]
MKYLMLLALSTLPAFANYEETNIETSAINIEGHYSKPKLSQADKVREYRRQLEAQNEEMLKKKMETLRLQQELLLMKKIQNAFNQSMQNIDNIQ